MYVIRAYNYSDLELIVNLWWKTWHQTFPQIKHPQPYSSWKNRFQDDLAVRGDIWVAEVEGYIAGFVVVVEEERELNQLFVDSDYQNQGVGKALLEQAKKISPQGLILTTLRSNTKACIFYENHYLSIFYHFRERINSG